MDRAVIIGTFNFLGFHFCTSILEAGYEVIGVHYDMEKEELLEEKRMEIGRNANFHEESYSKWLPLAEISKQTLVIIDLYNFHQRECNETLEKSDLLEKFLSKNKKRLQETDSKVIFLLPIQWLSGSSEMFTRTLPQEANWHYIYLPAIYGPWQPSSYIIQQALLKSFDEKRKIKLHEDEWIDDILYIDDVVEEILLMADKESASSFVLKNEIPDQWIKCAEYLAIPIPSYDNHHKLSTLDMSKIKIRMLKSQMQYSEGIEKQRRHLKLLLNGRF
ncbi:hypothetical protein ACFYKT_08315 [Cytobacillus sp. FJAT-53684]|uniref:NAD(P)-dependent oxidoreductase n=1 Tax=Cytobacillus mangrovibacter TaxID=3299024 RepID=A0ABW6JWU0_9BACI